MFNIFYSKEKKLILNKMIAKALIPKLGFNRDNYSMVKKGFLRKLPN